MAEKRKATRKDRRREAGRMQGGKYDKWSEDKKRGAVLLRR